MNNQNHNEDDDERSFFLPQRYLAVLLALVTVYHGFTCRSAYYDSIKIIVRHHNPGSNITMNCKNLEVEDSFKKDVEQRYEGIRYDWDETFLKTTAIFFQVGYISIHIVAGYFSDKYGAKNIVAVSIIGSSFTALCVPESIRQTKGEKSVVNILAFVTGFFHGPLLPGIATFLSHWIPKRERAFLCSIAFSGIFYAIVTLQMTAGPLVKKTNNWTLPCYIYGGLGILVFLFWWFFAYSDPSSNPHVSRTERIYLDTEMSNTVDHRKKSVPLMKIFFSLEVWALVIGSFGNLCSWFFAVSFLKTYMREVLRYSLSHGKLWSVIPYVAASISSYVNGFVVDWILRNDYVNLSTIRKVFTNMGTMGPAIYIVLASFVTCHRDLFKLMFLISNVLSGCIFAGIKVVPMDIAPNYSGVLTAFSNGVGLSSAIVMRHIIKTVAPNRTLEEYKTIFWIILGISSVSNLFFVICARIRLQKWNTPTVIEEKNK